MRRLVSLILAILLMINSGLVLAEETKEAPILFRDNKWGDSLPSVLKSFPSDVSFYGISADSAYQVENTIYDAAGSYFDGHVCGYINARSSSLKGMKVAGYEVTGITMRFAWVPNENGLIIEDDSHTALYYAEYEISPKDPDAVYTDLVAKLSTLYGDIDYTQEDGFIIKEKYSVWFGGDGTIVALVSEEYSSGNSDIEIRYGTTAGNDLLQTAYNALILKEKLDAASDTSGL